MEIKWLIRTDMDDVLRIENESFEYPWTEEELLKLLRVRNHIGMVCIVENRVVGYMIYELNKSHIDLKTIAVELNSRKSHIGKSMIERLKGKLSIERRTKIEASVRERNLPAQMFFSSQGFICEKTTADAYEDCDEAEYLFVYSIKPRFANRISQHLNATNEDSSEKEAGNQ